MVAPLASQTPKDPKFTKTNIGLVANHNIIKHKTRYQVLNFQVKLVSCRQKGSLNILKHIKTQTLSKIMGLVANYNIIKDKTREPQLVILK